MKNYESCSIRVVSNEEDRLKAMLVRSLVYMGEQNCPYEEEFDCNDHAATQIIGLCGSEPVLTARIRYFGSVAKLERLAVRKKYRGRGFGQQLLDFLLNFCQQKGFSQVYLHAQEGKEGFYVKNGFSAVNDRFNFSGYAYTEMVKVMPTSKQAIGLHSAAMMLNRPEGVWSRPGPLERCANYRTDIRLIANRGERL